ncbi:MAG: glycosyltransferase family 4 protein [Candidatus Peribacteraceae bacterium]|nr:glycosyltransferase family 4 protein [Candidatus Peribacteraceae bacterium]
MQIAIDIREACRQKKAGKGQWLAGFLSELISRNHQLLFLTDNEVPSSLITDSVNIKKLPSGPFWHIFASSYLKKQSDILYVSPTSTLVPCLLRGKIPVALVVHDLIAFQNEPHDKKAKWIERTTLKYALNKSEYIFTVSESTKNDLLSRFSKDNLNSVNTIYAGPLTKHININSSNSKTIVCPATLCPRKNQLRLIKAFNLLPDNLRDEYKLILIGARGWNDSNIIKLAECSKSVEWLNYVSDDEYERYLNECSTLALPSLYEGFGMQILDALQRGIPVLTSSRGSLKEIVGNAASLVDPERIEDISTGLRQILTDEKLRNRLKQEGPIQAEQFSWKRTVDIFLSTVEKV